MTDINVNVKIEIGEKLARTIRDIAEKAFHRSLCPGEEVRKAFNLDFTKIVSDQVNSKLKETD